MTDIKTETGMRIEADPETGAIASAPPVVAAEEAAPAPDPRKSVMDLIYANRAKVFEKELEQAAAQGFGATNETILDDQPEENDRKPEAEAQVTKPEELVTKEKTTNEPAPAAQKRTIMVDGRPIDFTEEEYSRLAERGMYNQPVAQQPQAPQPQQVSQSQRVEQAQENQPTDALRDIARRITYGNEEESTKALADLINTAVSRANQTQVNPNQIAQVAAQQAMAQIQFQKNLDAVGSEYADIFEKRASTLVAADHVNSLRYKYAMLGTPKSDLDLYREAGKLTREDFGMKSEATTPATLNKPAVQSADLGNKLERKRAAPKTPTAATKTIAMDAQRQVLTGSDIVAAMRKSRGQGA